LLEGRGRYLFLEWSFGPPVPVWWAPLIRRRV
jgi:hypothetical protein